jgi:hypothetical protein
MLFNLSELSTNINQGEMVVWDSCQGGWRIGLRRMLYGVRVFVDRVGDDCYTIDYCAGDMFSEIGFVLQLVLFALVPFEEDIGCGNLTQMFPFQNVKPIKNDLQCFNKLAALAQVGIKQLRETDDPESLKQCQPDQRKLFEWFKNGLDRVTAEFLKIDWLPL